MRRSSDHGALVLAAVFLIAGLSPVAAAEEMEQETGVSLTPRLWVAFIDPLAGAVAKKEAYVFPMAGLTLSIRPGGTPRYNFLLTGLYGSGDGDAIIPGMSLDTTITLPTVPPVDVPVSLQSAASRGETDADRMDLEFLVRRIYPDKWYSLFFGPRYATWDETTNAGFGYTISVNGVVTDAKDVDLSVDLETKLMGFQVGLGTVAEMSESGRHRLFSNFVFGAAYTEWESTARATDGTTGADASEIFEFVGFPGKLSGDHISPSLDANLGFQYSGERLDYTVRYRLFLLVEENALEQTQHTTIHGPEFSLTFRF